MAAPNSHVRVSGVWKKIKTKHVKVSGVWKKVKNAYVRVGGSWKKVYAGSFVFNATISANTQNYNLKSAAIAAGWNQVDPLVATVTINSGVYVGSSSTGSYAFDTGATFPAGSTLAVINNGYILGAGGASAAAGGTALMAQAPVTVTNNGTIGGGGGGGAVGATGSMYGATYTYYDGCMVLDIGGTVYGAGGAGGTGAGNYTTAPSAGSGGSASASPVYADTAQGGCGSWTSYICSNSWIACYAYGATGYTGGALGSQGGGGGGAAGACTSGNANITWAVAGTRNGALN